MYFPEGKFEAANRDTYRNAIADAGDEAVAEDALENAMSGLGDAAVAIFAGMRADAGVALTMAKYVPPLFKALERPRGAEGLEDAKYPRELQRPGRRARQEPVAPRLDLECFVMRARRTPRPRPSWHHVRGAAQRGGMRVRLSHRRIDGAIDAPAEASGNTAASSRFVPPWIASCWTTRVRRAGYG